MAIGMSLRAQSECDSTLEFYDQKYGRNTTLYKGAKYQPTINHQFGSPFFLNKTFQNGTVVFVNNTRYQHIKLKYDIYIDELVFETTDAYGAELNIVLDKADVDFFKLGNRRFEKRIVNGVTSYFETIRGDSIDCLLSYKKGYRFYDTPAKKGYGFTDTDRNILIILDGDITPVNNNFTLLRLLPKDEKNNIAKWLRDNDLRIRKVEFAELEKIIHKINKLIASHEV